MTKTQPVDQMEILAELQGEGDGQRRQQGHADIQPRYRAQSQIDQDHRQGVADIGPDQTVVDVQADIQLHTKDEGGRQGI